MKSLLVVSVFFLFLTGCVAEHSATQPIDPAKAWKGGECRRERGITNAEYTACLEQYTQLLAVGQGIEQRRDHVEIEVRKDPRPPASSSSSEEPSAPPPAPSPAVSPPPPPPVRPAYVPLPPVMSTVVIPRPQIGCDVQKSMTLLVDNPTDYVVEVRGPVAALTCMGDGVIPAMVLRHNGRQPVQTMVVPPRSDSYFVFTYPQGIGQSVQVEFDVYLNLGPEAPAPAIGYLKTRYQVPITRNFDHNWQDILPGLIRRF
ncbi:MAG: hypothetical protein ABIB04_00415 [Patescibacteria group bacterium]